MFTHIGVIGRRLLILAIVSATVPLFILGSLAVYNEVVAIRGQALLSLEIIAESAKGEIMDTIKYYKARTQDFSSDGFIRDSLEKINHNVPSSVKIVEELNKHLTLNKLSILPNAIETFILDYNGMVVSSSDSSRVGENSVYSEYFKHGSKDVYASDIIRDYKGHDPTWIVSSPVTSRNSGEFLGVIANRINPQILSDIMTGRESTFVSYSEDMFKRKRIGVTGESYIVNRDRLMLTESRFLDNVILNQIVDTKPVRLAFEHGGDMLGYYPDYRGVSVLGASKRIEEPGWLILAEIDRYEVLLPMRKFIISAIVIAILVVPIIFFVTLFEVKKVTKPIMDIADAAERITYGHLTERVQIHEKRGEIVRFSNAFNNMVESLLEANEEIKRFAYIVSHDMRAPLVNIKGFSSELRSALEIIDSAYSASLPHLNEKQKEEIARSLHEDIPEALGFIESSATHMDRLINSVLKLSRTGRRELDLQKIDMNSLVDAVIKTMAYQIDRNHVRIIKGLLPEVVADETSMEQIIGNILENAVSYLDPDRSGEIEITGEESENETVFHIRDNGRGIADADINKVFDLFYRSGKPDVSGEGMGLAYAKVIVQNHGGKIWCESKYGEGTTLSFTVSRYILKEWKNA